MRGIRPEGNPCAVVYNRRQDFPRKPMHFLPWLAAFVGGEIVDLVGETGPVAKMVLLLLLLFSVISWAIILSKWSLLRRARVQSGRFVRAFRKAQRLQDVGAVAEQFRPSPLVGVFEGGFEEYRRQGAVSSGVVRNPVAIQRAMQELRFEYPHPYYWAPFVLVGKT